MVMTCGGGGLRTVINSAQELKVTNHVEILNNMEARQFLWYCTPLAKKQDMLKASGTQL